MEKALSCLSEVEAEEVKGSAVLLTSSGSSPHSGRVGRSGD